jgi:hypothetical protein
MGFVPHVSEIVEYSVADAPLALVYQQQGLGEPRHERVEYRAVDGGLWVDTTVAARDATAFSMALGTSSVPPFFAGRKGIAENIDEIIRSLGASKRPPAQTLGPNSLVVHVVEKSDEYQLQPLMSMGLQGSVDEQVVHQIDAFTSLLQNFAVIDGRFYRREREPLIRLYPDGRWLSAGVERRGHASRPIKTFDAVPRSVGWFRMDDRAGMHEEAEAILAAMGNPGPLNDRISRIEVYDRVAIQEAPEAFAVYDVADAMRRHFQAVMHQDGASEEPGAALGRWLSKAALRDVRYFKAISGKLRGDRMSNDLPPELEEAFLAIAEDEQGEFANFSGGDRLKLYASEVARRWRDRPVTMEIFSNAPGMLL